jgi:hypothetical protein
MLGYLEIPGKPRVRTDCCVKFCIRLERLKKLTKIRIARDTINLCKEVRCAFASLLLL